MPFWFDFQYYHRVILIQPFKIQGIYNLPKHFTTNAFIVLYYNVESFEYKIVFHINLTFWCIFVIFLLNIIPDMPINVTTKGNVTLF